MTVLALKARSLDDFIFYDSELLHPAEAQTEDDAFARDVLVKVSVSFSSWPLLKRCVQRVRVRPGE